MAKAEKQNPIKLQEKVAVYSTDKDKHHVTGSEFKVHPVIAAKLFANGMATSEPTKATKAK